MSRTNERRHAKWHETCKCKCRLDASVCNNKQCWNNDKCRFECKKLIDKGMCDKLIDKLVEDCTESVEEVNLAKITSMKLHTAEDENKCKSSCTVYVILVTIIFTICIGIVTYFVYYKYMNHDKKKKTASRYDYFYQATNY